MKNIKICVVGLGYVGLPLARLFSTRYPTVGFDLNKERVAELMTGHDSTLEVEDALLRDAIDNHGFRCTTDIGHIRDCNFYVVAVPTPVDANNRPDLRPLLGASETVGKVISRGDIVVYDEQFPIGIGLRQDAVDHLSDERFCIVHRNDDTDRRGGNSVRDGHLSQRG